MQNNKTLSGYNSKRAVKHKKTLCRQILILRHKNAIIEEINQKNTQSRNSKCKIIMTMLKCVKIKI